MQKWWTRYCSQNHYQVSPWISKALTPGLSVVECVYTLKRFAESWFCLDHPKEMNPLRLLTSGFLQGHLLTISRRSWERQGDAEEVIYSQGNQWFTFLPHSLFSTDSSLDIFSVCGVWPLIWAQTGGDKESVTGSSIAALETAGSLQSYWSYWYHHLQIKDRD